MRALLVLSILLVAGCAAPAGEIDAASVAPATAAALEPLDVYEEERVVRASWGPVAAAGPLEWCGGAMGFGASGAPDDPASGGFGGPGGGGRTFHPREGAQRMVVTLTASDASLTWELCAGNITAPVEATGVSPLTLEVPLGAEEHPNIGFGLAPDARPVVQSMFTVNVTWWADAPAAAKP